MARTTTRFTFHPLTPERWDDFVTLFGSRGACGGCWCMNWRLAARQFAEGKGAKNKAAMKRLVDKGVMPGIMAYDGDRPIGWCSLGPRGDFVRLKAARTLKPVDDKPVWSIVCLFVDREYRNRRVSTALVEAAADFARTQGATLVEAYPYDYRHSEKPLPPPFVYTGLFQTFERAGFAEAARPSKTRAIMRRKA